MNAHPGISTLTNPFAPTVAPTLESIIERLDAMELPATRKRDYVSACRRVSDLLRTSLSNLSADPKLLRERLKEVQPELARLSTKTQANLRSNLLGALEAAGVSRVLKTAKTPLTSQWTAIAQTLPDRRFREGLSRFLRFCSANGIEPRDVSTEALLAFSEALDAGTFAAKPATITRDTATLWNRLVSARPALGLTAVDCPSRRRAPTRVDLSTLPESFLEDVDAYLAWALGEDLFDHDSPTRPLSAQTGRLRRQQIHSAVDALIQSGTPADSIRSLAQLVTPEAVRSILRYRHKNAGGVPNAYNAGIAKTLVSVAYAWVKVDLATLEAIKGFGRRLPSIRGEMTDKNKALLRHFDDKETFQRLYYLPQNLWAKTKDQPLGNKSLARAQSAIAIAILFYVPLRVANLSALQVGASLILPRSSGDVVTIDIPADQTKNRNPYRAELPAHVSQMVVEFEKLFLRPLGTTYLFDTGKGHPKRKETISYLIERVIQRAMGFHMTQHQFRHLAAMISLDADPGAYANVTTLLGHASLKTAMKFYAEQNTKRAARHHATLLAKALGNSDGTPGDAPSRGRKSVPAPAKSRRV